jgi:hypothetical protein
MTTKEEKKRSSFDIIYLHCFSSTIPITVSAMCQCEPDLIAAKRKTAEKTQ